MVKVQKPSNSACYMPWSEPFSIYRSDMFPTLQQRVWQTAYNRILSLCLINYTPKHEDVWGSRGVAPSFLTSASCPVRVTPGETRCWYVRFEVFTAVTMKNAVFWDVALCRSCVNRLFEGTYRFHLQGRKVPERGTSVSRWLETGTLWS
jgi:hypothetical protein